MRLKISLIFALVFSFLLTACDDTTVNTPDGSVPAEYLTQAQTLEGVYTGTFNKIKGTLTIHFNGSKPIVSFAGANGNDLLGANCSSSLGQLESVTVHQSGSDKNPDFVSASFVFDPGQCGKSLQGRTLDLDFHKKSNTIKVAASIYRYSQTFPGGQTCTPTPNGGQYCSQQPPQTVDYYLEGSFQK